MARSTVASVTMAAAVILGAACVQSGSEDERLVERRDGDRFVTEDRARFEVECGPDVIELLARWDPEMVALSDVEFAAKWLARVRCLAERGDAESQLTLGIVYRDGSDGPPQDYTEAAIWFRRAAEQAHPMAQFNLGRLYEGGRGVPQDLILAYMWYSLAASGFDWRDDSRVMAFRHRDRLESRLTPAQLRTAQQMASEWWVERNR